ncbi:hypothetical protein ACP275_12G049600 [Erythranthe tilingii]
MLNFTNLSKLTIIFTLMIPTSPRMIVAILLASVIREFNGCNKNIGINYEEKSLECLRVLLAEDTPVQQRVAKVMLEKLGVEVVVVGDGIQAVEALDRDRK